MSIADDEAMGVLIFVLVQDIFVYLLGIITGIAICKYLF